MLSAILEAVPQELGNESRCGWSGFSYYYKSNNKNAYHLPSHCHPTVEWPAEQMKPLIHHCSLYQSRTGKGRKGGRGPEGDGEGINRITKRYL